MTNVLEDCLSQSTLAATPELAERFQSAQPFSHLVIDGFFEAGFCQSLLQEFPAFDKEKARNENGTIGRKAVYTELRNIGRHYRTLDHLVRSDAFFTVAE